MVTNNRHNKDTAILSLLNRVTAILNNHLT